MYRGWMACDWALTWAEPYGLVPTNPASQAWTCVLAWYTGHTVGGLRHPGTCLSRRAFPTILALQPSLDQRPCLPYRSPGLWSAALAGATTAGGWGTLHRLMGYSCPCPQLLPNQSIFTQYSIFRLRLGHYCWLNMYCIWVQ